MAELVLTQELLKAEAALFATTQSESPEEALYGVTDGKAVGTYLEHKFQSRLLERYSYPRGNSAKGIDFPGLDVDIKVTSIKQPQSSCPFRDARQKIYGLGYSLLVCVYEKTDDESIRAAHLNILHTIFVEREKTADFQTTSGLRKLLENHANRDDILAFIEERRLPLDEVGAVQLADEILKTTPELGYLTISNALQWRLQYGRVIQEAGKIAGISRLIP
jgi:hypothetical protein